MKHCGDMILKARLSQVLSLFSSMYKEAFVRART